VDPLKRDYERTFYPSKILNSDPTYYWNNLLNFMSSYRNETQTQINYNKNNQKQIRMVIILTYFYLNYKK
jgi:hypothetical protein